MHFGGSRNQVSLHTSVLYHNNNGQVESVPFCTLSDDRRHNIVAICAHLTPIIKYIKTLVPTLNEIHFVSDGPSNQYKNRKKFDSAAKLLTKLANAKSLYWHYLEVGHGKGAPDGVGGCIKRTADNIVARGIDIPDLNTLMEQLKINCKGIKILQVPEKEIDEINFEEVIPTFAGTLKTHQISWCEDSARVINIRRLYALCSHAVNARLIKIVFTVDWPNILTIQR